MTYNATDSEEPDNNRDHFRELGSICSLNSANCDSLEEFQADIQIEDCRDTNWPEETNEDCLPFLVDLMDEFVHGEHNWKTSAGVSRYRARTQERHTLVAKSEHPGSTIYTMGSHR